MKKKSDLLFKIGVFFTFLIPIFFQNCKENENIGLAYDPKMPIVCEEFFPDSGGVGTQLIIRGSNFGIDTSLVRVSVNGKNAAVIGVNETVIYAVVPRRADVGPVEVTIGKDNEKQAHTFPNNFEYRFSQVVSTLCGHTKNDGSSEVINGTLEDAWLVMPRTLTVDNEGDLYLIEEGRGLRVISQSRNEVTSPFRGSGGMSNAVMLDFSADYNTLYITNEVWDDNGIGLFTTTRDNGFMNARSLIKQKQASDVAVNPVDGTLFYACKPGGSVYRYDFETKTSTLVTTLGGDNFISMTFTPDGKILYLMGADTNAIYKSIYNFTTKGLENPTVFAGTQFSAGYADGVGTAAQFRVPFQGAVDEDGNLYVAEFNHVIRKITPDGVVSTFAGVPERSGYIDGKPSQARFKEPMGVAVDKEGTVYVADRGNHRIRMIKYD
ncbi:SMP-30/gluconolactonase/LRE family protein [Dysgonomonas termitidis]|uniref:SMP-30/gluconolactonase/LRE family protein n=1 Tax=Dysgonomonas termitidis TaxID=1516126 RepID=A0ABV9KVY2_9BACT